MESRDFELLIRDFYDWLVSSLQTQIRSNLLFNESKTAYKEIIIQTTSWRVENSVQLFLNRQLFKKVPKTL